MFAVFSAPGMHELTVSRSQQCRTIGREGNGTIQGLVSLSRQILCHLVLIGFGLFGGFRRGFVTVVFLFLFLGLGQIQHRAFYLSLKLHPGVFQIQVLLLGLGKRILLLLGFGGGIRLHLVSRITSFTGLVVNLLGIGKDHGGIGSDFPSLVGDNFVCSCLFLRLL